MSRDIHLVGSVGLDTVPEVFEAVGELLDGHVCRVPDGEPGGRRMWIGWQYPLLRSNAFLEVDPEAAGRTNNGFQPLRVVPGVKPEDITFSELGYAREARASYLDFLEARKRGVLKGDVRFQVCFPTPYAVVRSACVPAAQPLVEPAYERAMLRDVQTVCAAIPHDDLCIQWDIAAEMVIWDGRSRFLQRPENFEQMMRERIARQSAVIPAAVELGYHLCYGDLDARHMIEPEDTARLVEMANLIVSSAKHKVAYIHMPVPIARHDDAYFAPLENLKIGDTKLFLGLVHAGDGVEGTKRRMDAAAKVRADFGIASECGISRVKTPALVREILRIHGEAAR